jgi:hypothetical protein
MNLHAIAGPIVAAVNPTIVGQLRVSIGTTIDAAGARSPLFETVNDVAMQVQALTGPELAHVDGLNIQGTKRAVYLYGDVQGVNRPAAKGGDMLVFNGRIWLVVAVLETWDRAEWCKVAVVEQMP